MGQYYKFIILSDSVPEKGMTEIIRIALSAHEYNNGAKLTEHSYIGNNFLSVIEWLISPHGMFYKTRIVWAGDYADAEPIIGQNLYNISSSYEEKNTYPIIRPPKDFDANKYRYIINHTKREYIDKFNLTIYTSSYDNREYIMHPLPLLVSEGNGRGGGDYGGENKDICGIWARDVISVEESMPSGYTERVCVFSE